MKVAAKRLWNISQDEEMRDLLEAREKQIRDHVSSVEYARQEGREEGHLKEQQRNPKSRFETSSRGSRL